METGGDIKKVKLLTEESSVYSSSISKFVNKFIINIIKCTNNCQLRSLCVNKFLILKINVIGFDKNQL